MSNYKKFSLDTIRQKLKDGEYASLVGVMRAIGKTQELSEADKEKARVMARKHFGAEAPVAKVKKAPKKAAKKAGKKAVKKAAKAPKAARKKKASKKSAPALKAVAKKVSKKAAKKAVRSKPAAVTEEDAETSPAAVEGNIVEQTFPPNMVSPLGSNIVMEMGQVISTGAEALKAMEAAKRLFPKAKLEHDVGVVTGAMTRAVKIIDQEVMAPRLSDSKASVQAAPAPTRKKAAKKGTRAKAQTTAPVAVEEAEGLVANGVHERDLSEVEQEQLRLARETQPQSASS
jgi:hypothetical protein